MHDDDTDYIPDLPYDLGTLLEEAEAKAGDELRTAERREDGEAIIALRKMRTALADMLRDWDGLANRSRSAEAEMANQDADIPF